MKTCICSIVTIGCIYSFLTSTSIAEPSAAELFIQQAKQEAQAASSSYTYDDPRFPSGDDATAELMEARLADGSTEMIRYRLDPEIHRKALEWREKLPVLLKNRPQAVTSRFYRITQGCPFLTELSYDGKEELHNVNTDSYHIFTKVTYDDKGRVVDIFTNTDQWLRDNIEPKTRLEGTFLREESFCYEEDAILIASYNQGGHMYVLLYDGTPPRLPTEKPPRMILKVQAGTRNPFLSLIQTIYELDSNGKFIRAISYEESSSETPDALPCQAKRYLFELDKITNDEMVSDATRCDAYTKMAQFRPAPGENCWDEEYDTLNEKALQMLLDCQDPACHDGLVEIADQEGPLQEAARTALFWRGDYRYEPPMPALTPSSDLESIQQQACTLWEEDKAHFFVRYMRKWMSSFPQLSPSQHKNHHTLITVPCVAGRQVCAIQLAPLEHPCSLLMAAALPSDAKLYRWKIVPNSGNVERFKTYYKCNGHDVPGPWPETDQVILAATEKKAIKENVTYCIWLYFETKSPGTVYLAATADFVAFYDQYGDETIAELMGFDHEILKQKNKD